MSLKLYDGNLYSSPISFTVNVIDRAPYFSPSLTTTFSVPMGSTTKDYTLPSMIDLDGATVTIVDILSSPTWVTFTSTTSPSIL